MIPFRVIAIPTGIAEQVRNTHESPGYGHPAYTALADGYGPCRHCLKTFHLGAEQRTLFTFDPFAGLEKVPLPGPVFIHADVCERYPEGNGYPPDLLVHAALMNAYARGQKLVAKIYADIGSHNAAVQHLLERSDVDYIEVRDLKAGCYDFRIERARAETSGATT